MKANLRSIRKLRVYSEEFKKQLVSEFEGGKHSVLQLEQLHGVPNSTIGFINTLPLTPKVIES
jgi:transposase